jgi:hypothetical protein
MLKMVVEGFYMVIRCIFFLVFAQNFVVIYSTPKIINVSYNDNVMNLSYIINVILCI